MGSTDSASSTSRLTQDRREGPSEDPLVRFHLRALKLAPQLGFEPTKVNEALGILRTLFGEEWLRRVEAAKDQGSAFAARAHPIGHALSVAGPLQVALLLELSSYLVGLHRAPGFESAVLGLRAARQFESTMLQLGLAYRCSRAGGSDLILEPVASGGRQGDLAFNFGGQRYMVECYVRQEQSPSTEECERLATRVLRNLASRRLVYSVCVALESMPSPRQRKELGRRIQAMADHVDQMSLERPKDFASVVMPDETATLSVTRWVSRTVDGMPPEPVAFRSKYFPRQGDDWDFVARSGLYQADSAFSLENQSFIGRTGSEVAIWLPPHISRQRSLGQDLSAPLEGLINGIEKKLVQTRTPQAASRVIVVSSWIAGEIHRAPPALLERMHARLLEAHKGVEGVLLVRRTWDEARSRYVYGMAPLLRLSATETTHGLLEALQRGEASPPFGQDS